MGRLSAGYHDLAGAAARSIKLDLPPVYAGGRTDAREAL